MKCILATLLLLLSPAPDSVGIMFWNLENFFDCRDGGGGESDREFSATGGRHWTRKRFQSKCSSIAKGIFWAADRHGMPAVICVAEIEHRGVLRRLLESTGLRKFDYAIVHHDSPDPRGIDVALFYDRRRLRLEGERACPVQGTVTRDLLAACFTTPAGDSLAVTVVHLPSQYSGSSSAGRRSLAVRSMLALADSLDDAGWHRQVVIGDFNDIPSAAEFEPLSGRFVNLTAVPWSRGEGTIRFDGRWELIDQCIVSPSLSPRSRANVCAIPFLTVKDTRYGGQKPLRTYSGPRYLGGVSDHYPICAEIVFQ